MALHPTIRRATRLLGASFAVAWLTFSMAAGPGPAAFVRLSGRLGDAGLYFALFALLAAAGAGLGGSLMDRLGRRRPLVGAHVLMAAGFAAAGAGVVAGSLAAFVAGVAATALGMGVVYLTRLAAADLYPPALRGRGVAWVLVSATAGAIVGPLLLAASEPLGALLGYDPRGIVWFLAPPLLLGSAALVALAPEPSRIAHELARYHPGVPLDEPAAASGPIPRRPLVAGAATLALAGAAMVAVMGVAGPSVEGAGHGFTVLGVVMAFHFAGMFALSTLVGKVADRVGRRATMLLGLAVLAVGGLGVAALPGVEGFAAGLLLIGLGWSFAYIGASVLLADITPLARRARVLGRADLLSSLCQAALATAGGWWFAERGIAGLGLVAAGLMLLPALAVVFLREPRPGSYGAPAPA